MVMQDKCPVAVLVGVDATPDPGLRGPTNFAGTLCSRDIVHLNQTLANARCACDKLGWFPQCMATILAE